LFTVFQKTTAGADLYWPGLFECHYADDTPGGGFVAECAYCAFGGAFCGYGGAGVEGKPYKHASEDAEINSA